jgi:selenoprotein W-related protein
MSAANPQLPALSIEYCLECCETLRALNDAQEILMQYEDRISQLTLVPGENGMFEVAVGENLVFSKHHLGRHPEEGELVRLVGAALKGSPVST